MSDTTPAAGMPTIEVRLLELLDELESAARDVQRLSATNNRQARRARQRLLNARSDALALLAKGAESQAPAGWREHVENRLRMWRQRRMNRHGDMLVLADFMNADSLDDLIDFVCDELVGPSDVPAAQSAPSAAPGAAAASEAIQATAPAVQAPQMTEFNFNPKSCYCACATGGPCEHAWDGPVVDTDDHFARSVTCSRCGCTAMSHSMRTAP